MKPRSPEEFVQGLVHSLEAGGLARLIRLALTLAAFVALALILLLAKFRGLSEADGMEQAQIAREFARGNGLVTQQIQPVDLWLAARKGEDTIAGKLPSTSYAPLWSITLGTLFKFSDVETWEFSRGSVIYPGDRWVAATGVAFLLLAFGAAWLLAWQIFDGRVAWAGVILMALCPPFWEFAMSGLSQTMVMFWFLLAMNTLFRACLIHCDEARGVWIWLLLTAFFLGLATLAHGLACWAMFGVVLFVLIALPRRRLAVLPMLLLFGLVLAPWLVRNQMVFGNPFGKGILTVLEGVRGPIEYLFSKAEPELGSIPFMGLVRKTANGVLDQITSVIELQGGILIVPFFFLALLHPFKRPATGLFRWMIALVWLCLIGGMALFGNASEVIDANQLQILVAPLFVFYAIAFMFVLTVRFSNYAKLVRIAMLTVVYLFAAIPMAKMVLFTTSRLHYPPYFPPVLVAMKQLTEPEETVSADVAWAVAWYADRRTLLMPETPAYFTEINDFRRLGTPIAGLMMTPYSANAPMLLDVLYGRWKPWAPILSRTNIRIRNFPCTVPLALPPEGQNLALFDRKRW